MHIVAPPFHQGSLTQEDTQIIELESDYKGVGLSSISLIVLFILFFVLDIFKFNPSSVLFEYAMYAAVFGPSVGLLLYSFKRVYKRRLRFTDEAFLIERLALFGEGVKSTTRHPIGGLTHFAPKVVNWGKGIKVYIVTMRHADGSERPLCKAKSSSEMEARCIHLTGWLEARQAALDPSTLAHQRGTSSHSLIVESRGHHHGQVVLDVRPMRSLRRLFYGVLVPGLLVTVCALSAAGVFFLEEGYPISISYVLVMFGIFYGAHQGRLILHAMTSHRVEIDERQVCVMATTLGVYTRRVMGEPRGEIFVRPWEYIELSADGYHGVKIARSMNAHDLALLKRHLAPVRRVASTRSAQASPAVSMEERDDAW